MTRIIILFTIGLLTVSGYAADSLMTVQEYQTKIYQAISADTNGTDLLDDALVMSYAKDAITRVYTDIGLPMQKKITITDGDAAYLVDNGLVWVKGATFDTNQTFSSLRPIEAWRLTDESYYSNLEGTYARPKFYIRQGDSITLYPAPEYNDTIYVFYFARGAFPATDTTTISVPLEMRQAIIYAGAELCQIRRSNWAAADKFHERYMNEVARIRTKFEIEGNRIEK